MMDVSRRAPASLCVGEFEPERVQKADLPPCEPKVLSQDPSYAIHYVIIMVSH